jgi:hypothetical protein
MSSRDGTTVAKRVAANIAAAGLLSVGTAVGCAATAAADPPPPVPADPADPAPPPDPAAWDPAAPPQTALGTMSAVLNQSTPSPTGFDLLLSQTSVPGTPGGQPPAPPDLSVVNTLPYLFGPNEKLSEQGQQSMYSAGATDLNAPAPTGRIDAFQRAHGLWHEGLGRLDQGQLGQPLPGTAPPPGTNLPPGPVQFLPDGYGTPYGTVPPPPGTPPPGG